MHFAREIDWQPLSDLSLLLKFAVCKNNSKAEWKKMQATDDKL